MSSFLVSNQTQLNAAVAKANGGDQIVLASNFKAQMISVDGFNKVGGLTIVSQDPDAVASVAILKIMNSSGITVRNVDVSQTPNATQTASILNSSNILLDGLHIHGSEDLSTTRLGMTIRSSSNVTVTNSQFDHLNQGLQFLNSNNVTLQSNRVSQIVNDGFIGSGTSDLTIKENYFTDFRHTGDVHPDCIQIYTKPGDSPVHDIIVTGNVFNRGGGTPVQGIWIKNDSQLAPFENVTVTNNTIIGSMYQGIGITSVGSLVLTGNRVQGYSDQVSKISVTDTNGHVVALNNASTWFSFTGSNDYFVGNYATNSIPSDTALTVNSAIATFTSANLSGMSNTIQKYMNGISSKMPVSNWWGSLGNGILPVVGSAADMLAHPGMIRQMGGSITGDNFLTAAQTVNLSTMGRLSLADGAHLTVRGAVSDLIGNVGYAATHFALTTGIQITSNNVLNTSQAATVDAWDHVTVAQGASVTVTDWAVNVIKSFNSIHNLISEGVVSSVTLNDKAPVLQITDSQYTDYTDVLAAITGPVKQNVKVAAGHSVTARDASATLDGSLGNAILSASNSGNTLIGGAGDRLIGGLGKDTFVLHGHFGQETIVGFDNADVLQFDRAMVADFKHLQPHMQQVGDDLVIDLGAGDVVTLAHTHLADLNSADFLFF